MIIISLYWRVSLLILFVYSGILFAVFRKSKKLFLKWMLIGIYVLFLAKYILFPIVIVTRSEMSVGPGWNIRQVFQLWPFRSIRSYLTYSTWKVQLLGNLILLMPFAVLLVIYGTQNMGCRRIMLYSLAASIGFESLQLFEDLITHYPNHVVDIDDVILNCTGALAAVLFYRIVRPSKWFLKLKQSLYCSRRYGSCPESSIRRRRN